MDTIELIKDIVLFGGNLPNDRKEEVIIFLNNTENEWISVKDRLPTEEGAYIVFRDGDFEFCRYIFPKELKEGYWHDYLGITHWAFIPNPPKQ